ncbi:MAG TPA: VIT domain-containing protein [Myxococcota bacterium]|nr:VIT domain-containing protein [Myxococcota bacterium]
MSAEPIALLTSTEGAAIPLQGVSARGRLRGLLFELTVEQTYENRSAHNVEAVYTFPLPHRAVFLGLEVELGGRMLAAQAVRTDRAHREYEQALDRGDSAVLLEQASDGLYTASLGNLMAGERAVIRYRYAELLAPAQCRLRLAIPTVIARRATGRPSGRCSRTRCPAPISWRRTRSRLRSRSRARSPRCPSSARRTGCRSRRVPAVPS